MLTYLPLLVLYLHLKHYSTCVSHQLSPRAITNCYFCSCKNMYPFYSHWCVNQLFKHGILFIVDILQFELLFCSNFNFKIYDVQFCILFCLFANSRLVYFGNIIQCDNHFFIHVYEAIKEKYVSDHYKHLEQKWKKPKSTEFTGIQTINAY